MVPRMSAGQRTWAASSDAEGAAQVARVTVQRAVAREAASSPLPQGGNGSTYWMFTITVAEPSGSVVIGLFSSSVSPPSTVFVCVVLDVPQIRPTNVQT
jgi:hypothetical protein